MFCFQPSVAGYLEQARGGVCRYRFPNPIAHGYHSLDLRARSPALLRGLAR